MIRQEYAIIMLVVFFIIGCFWFYMNGSELDLKCIISTKDGNKYCVRDRGANTQLSADLLSQATVNMQKLSDHLKENFSDNPAVKRLNAGFNAKKISEILPNSELTAYTENKSKMSFCLTEKKEGTKLIDLNTLTFVAIHEMSHIATKSIGHKQEFWDNFKFFLAESQKINIYKPVDYKKDNKEFCSLVIKDNPIYDM